MTATILLLFFLSACASPVSAPTAPAPEEGYAPRTLYDLGGLENLQAKFNANAGLSRLILLMSPT